MITPVHWAAALFVATVLHVAALTWLHQPRARIDPAEVDSGIVISLQPAAARQRQNVEALAEPAETGSDIRDQAVRQTATDAAAPERRDVAPPETARPTGPEAAVVSGTEPVHTGTDVRDQPVQQPATDAAAPERWDVAPPETAGPTGPEAAAVSGAEPAAAALLEAQRPAPARELRIPVAPPSVDVAAPGTEPVLPASVQSPAPQPVMIDAPEEVPHLDVEEAQDTPIPALAPVSAEPAPPGTTTLPAAAVAPAMQPLGADSPADASARDTAEIGEVMIPELREPVSIGVAPSPPLAAPPRAEDAARDLRPEDDLRSRTVVLELESVQPVPEAQSAVTPAEEVAPTQSLTPAEVVMAKAVPATPLQARAKQDLAGVTAQYAGLLKGWLKRHMHYPRQAWLDGNQGTAIIRFSIDRSGAVLGARLEHSSGHQVLDEEVLQMVRRADPFPAIPADILGQELAIRVPVRFHIADYGRTRYVPPIELK